MQKARCLNMAKRNKKKTQSSRIIVGFILVALSYPAYLAVIAISRAFCNVDGHVTCDLSTGIGLYYLSLLVSIVLALFGLFLILYGAIRLLKISRE